jgi:hypothetical protein
MRRPEKHKTILQPPPLHLFPQCMAVTPALFPVTELHTQFKNRKAKQAQWFRTPAPAGKASHLCVRMFSVRMQPWLLLRTQTPLRQRSQVKNQDDSEPLEILSSPLALAPGNGMALWTSVNRHPPGHAPCAPQALLTPKGTPPIIAMTPTRQMIYSQKACRLQ